MTPDQISQLIDQKIQQNNVSGPFQQHAHNKTNSNQISAVNIKEFIPLPPRSKVNGVTNQASLQTLEFAGNLPIPIIYGHGVGDQSEFNEGDAQEGALAIFVNVGIPLYQLWVYLDGEWQTVSSNGATGGINGFQVFTSSGTFTPPIGFSNFLVQLCGPGGNGGVAQEALSSAPGSGGGGGAGGYCSSLLTLSSPQTVTIASSGSSSSFGTFLTANSGSNGANGIASGSTPGTGTGGAGGTATGGQINIQGGDGGTGLAVNGALPAAVSGYGGASYFGGGAHGVTSTTGIPAGGNGVAYGSGASGGAAVNSTGTAGGGFGAKGVCIITW